MNKILLEIRKIMMECVETYLSDISSEDLEDNGAIFYMNGKNGTEFDWYVNDKISDFMMFYNDEDNMGAVKTTLYNNGEVLTYVYGEQGKTVVQRINTHVDVIEDEILHLAIVLRNEADDKRIWDEGIENIDTDLDLNTDMKNDFLSHEHYYDEMKERKAMLGKVAYVSKKITDEGWKIGYMCRDEIVRENESGWSFMAGNEDDEYIGDYHNIQLMTIYEVLQYDWTISKYINSPIGTRLIRVSSEEFEEDQNDKEIYMDKM